MATNLGNMSAIMAINNVSMEEQIGMLTGVTEITRNASSASRGLVMISSRLTQVLDDTSSTGKKLNKIYEGLGIELKDSNGQLRSHYDILSDLAKQWDNLSENEQKYIALTSSGARQQQNFVALMENWNQVAKATATAYNSIGSAQKENEKVMDSIAKKVEILKSQFQQLIIGKGGLQDFAKIILNIGIALLKFANSDVGKTIIQLTLLVTAFNLVKKGINALSVTALPKLIMSILKLTGSLSSAVIEDMALSASLKELIIKEIEATGTTVTFSEALEGLKAAILSNSILLFVAGLVALTGVMIYLAKKEEEEIERQKEAKQNIIELEKEINKLKGIEENESRLSQADKDRLAYLEKRLELERQLAKAAIDREEKAKETVANSAFINGRTPAEQREYLQNKEKNAETERIRKTNRNEDDISLIIRDYQDLNNELRNWKDLSEEGTQLWEEKDRQAQEYAHSLEAERDRLGELRDRYEQNAREYDILQNKKNLGIELTSQEEKKLKELEGSTKHLSQEEQSRLAILEANVGAYHKSIDAIKTYQEAVDEFGENSEEADSIIKEFAKDLGISEEAFISNAEALGLSIDAYYESAKAIKACDEAIDNFQSSLGTLQQAVDEYNESQYLSIDTIQALLQLQPEYLSMLVEENGQLKLNENAIVDKCNALIEERKQTALQMAYDRLAAIERGENKEAAEKQSVAIDGNTDSLNTETTALSKNTVEQYANRIARNDKAKGTAASEVIRDLEKELAILDKIGNNYSQISKSATKAGRSGSSGAKSAKSAQSELNKELEETKKKYEQVIKYINKRYDREIKKIKDAKSEAIKAEEKKIKAKEKEKDHALDAIEKEIKALKKEQDARKEYWSDRIDALKKQNEALKDSLELQEKLDALEEARNTKVKIYKEGQGFVYDVDQTKIAKAQKALDEYLSEKAYEDELERLEALKDAELDNYEKRLDALNEYKDSVQENYEKQIEHMNEYKDELSEQYDAQIDEWENYKEKFGDLVDSYEEQQNKLLFEQLMGIKDENSNWLTRLDNLAEFVKKYNELQNQLNTGNTNVSNTASFKEGTGSGSKTRNSTNSNTTTTSAQYDSRGFKLNEGYSSSNNKTSTTKTGYIPTEVAKKLGTSTKVYSHANGVSSIRDDELAIVGENPNQEIVIGSKLNNGSLMSLNKGSGVVNADSSSTLAGMLNQVSKFGSSGFGSGNGTLNNNINNDSLTINGVTIQGANINDPQTFVNGLLSLKAEALQRAYRHR